MKAQPSFKCHVVDLTDLNTDSKPNIKSDETIDLDKLVGDRRVERKANNKRIQRRTDPVRFVDLKGTADYEAFFSPHLDPKLTLNTKGPFANLFWSFSKLEEDKSERRVSLL